MQVSAGLVVNAHPVGAGIGESRDELVGILDHQVAVERQFCCLAQAAYHRRPDGDVGHEMAVHHVHVDHRAAAALGSRNLVRKMRKISRKYRWQQFNHGESGPAGPRRQCIRAPGAA